MLPILRQFYLRAGDIGRLPPGHVVGFFRPMVTELTERKLDQILELLRISPEALAQDLRASLPRIEAFKRLFSLVGADIDDIERAAERIMHLAADHAYKLRRAIETERSKFMYRGARFRIPTFLQMIRPVALEPPRS
jgi:predicted ATP-grasp superfamily ATP-dependent carboligase